MLKQNLRRGFTLIELSVTLAIVATLIAYATVNLTSIQSKTYLVTTIDTFLSDLKQQQLKAMVGDTEGRGTNDYYGIYFEQNQYTLFHGSTYAADVSNFTIPLTTNVQFSNVTFPQSQIVFNKGDGSVVGFSAGSNTFTLRNPVTGEQKTITINRYGVVTAIN